MTKSDLVKRIEELEASAKAHRCKTHKWVNDQWRDFSNRIAALEHDRRCDYQWHDRIIALENRSGVYDASTIASLIDRIAALEELTHNRLEALEEKLDYMQNWHGEEKPRTCKATIERFSSIEALEERTREVERKLEAGVYVGKDMENPVIIAGNVVGGTREAEVKIITKEKHTCGECAKYPCTVPKRYDFAYKESGRKCFKPKESNPRLSGIHFTDKPLDCAETGHQTSGSPTMVANDPRHIVMFLKCRECGVEYKQYWVVDGKCQRCGKKGETERRNDESA